MKLYSYVMTHDTGFSPNPFFGYCTLACCKPKIRRHAVIGDWVVGTGSVDNVGGDKIIYVMEVTKVISLEKYSQDKTYSIKIPSEETSRQSGDNIYYKDKNNNWLQRRSYHCIKEMKKDLEGRYALISTNYCYFGKKAILVPKQHEAIIKKGPGHKCRFPQHVVDDFISWIRKVYKPGVHGEPYGKTLL